MSVLDEIYNAFDPVPLPAGSPLYVVCDAVRGGTNILIELGNTILRSNRPTCQLYTGHRGGGKSTELLRLKADLEQKGCYVVYFAAEDTDINPEDVEYTDILLACTRHLLEELRNVDPNPVLSWLRDRWQALMAVLQTDISLKDVKAEVQIQQIAKITGAIRVDPSQRYQIRQLLNPHTETLVKALNQFIADALPKLPQGKTKLVVIADGLDKIVPIQGQDGRTNHDEIFLDRCEQLKALNCHVIYTVPISLALSSRASDLADIYNCAPLALPMIMIQTRDNQIHLPGLETLKGIVRTRMHSVPKVKNMALEVEVFANPETLTELCRITGGHVRNLVFLLQTAIKYNEDRLPLQAEALKLAIRQLRNTYRNTVEDDQWAMLATVARSKRITNTDAYRSLLFSRCVLEYVDEEGQIWHDIHPVIEQISEFREAAAR